MCVFRIVGKKLDTASLAATLNDAGLKAFVHRSRHQVTVPVSEGSWSDLLKQFSDAESFLGDRDALIQEIAGRADVESLGLDFPAERKSDFPAQFLRFPASLVSKAGALGIELELSSYQIANDE